MSSEEGENDALEKAYTRHQDNASEANALSLFGGGDIAEIDDTVLEDMEDIEFVVCNRLFPALFTGQVRQLQVALLS